MTRSPKDALDRLVDATPDRRDRVVDAMRALSIAVVIVWHWSLSLTHRDPSGVLVNPNPLEAIPGSWAATWVLQVMPVFFIVGGYANLAAWSSLRNGRPDGRVATAFLRRRARRLLGPVAVFVAIWAVIAIVVHGWSDDRRSVIETYAIVLNPLWFVAAYLIVVLLVPITATAHRRAPRGVIIGLAAGIAAADIARFTLGVDAWGWTNFVLVWVLVHQFGYLWHDGWFGVGWSRRATGVLVVGLVGLVALSSMRVYPRSLVATEATEISHLSPPTALIPFVALLQLGLILAARPVLERWLQRRRPWSIVVGVNAVILTVFLWHMTALLISILVFEAAGGTLGDDATLSWWLTRPLWVIGPGLVLIPLVAVLAVFEIGRRD